MKRNKIPPFLNIGPPFLSKIQYAAENFNQINCILIKKQVIQQKRSIFLDFQPRKRHLQHEIGAICPSVRAKRERVTSFSTLED